MSHPLTAALRIRKCLEEAKENNHYKDAWYAYMSRRDVEAVVDAVLDGKLLPRSGPVDENGDPCETYHPVVDSSHVDPRCIP